jgi:hypothetical protein
LVEREGAVHQRGHYALVSVAEFAEPLDHGFLWQHPTSSSRAIG